MYFLIYWLFTCMFGVCVLHVYWLNVIMLSEFFFFFNFFSWSKCKRQLQLLNQIFLRAPHTSIGVPKIKQSLSNLVPSLFLPGLAWFCTFGQYFFIMSENHNQITITVFSQYFYNDWQLLGSKNFFRDFQGYTRFHYSCLHLKVRQRGRNF